jgi:hypothetical protein
MSDAEKVAISFEIAFIDFQDDENMMKYIPPVE